MEEMYPLMISGNGIMSDLSDFNVPWANDIADGMINHTFLDMGYYQHSAGKTISPFIWNLADMESQLESTHELDELTAAQRTKIAGTIHTIYSRKWDRLWNLYKMDYNPIQNYNISETENTDTDNSSTYTNTGTITNVLDSDGTQTGTVGTASTGSINNDVFGFNSSSAVPYDKADGATNTTRTDNLANSEDSTHTETRNLGSSETGTHDTDRTLTRSGNIGVTTTQRMFESEIDVWKWNFFKSVFADIDQICCLDVY